MQLRFWLSNMWADKILLRTSPLSFRECRWPPRYKVDGISGITIKKVEKILNLGGVANAFAPL